MSSQRNFIELSPSKTNQVSNSLSDSSSSQIEMLSPITAIDILFWIMFSGFLGLLAFLAILKLKKIQDKTLPKLGSNHKIPCYKCHFFHKNSYLQCAVNPEKATTDEAIDCLDYREKKHS